MKLKYFIFGILVIIIIGLSLVSLYVNSPKNKSENTISEKNLTNYNFESNWWLKPQTYGMYNYFHSTNYTRLEITNCTVNGYRLVFDLNNVDYKKDIENAHEKNIKYVTGILFDATKDELSENSNSICLPYELIKNNSLIKAKKIIDLGVDGLAIIHPFGGDLFMEKGISCLCPESSRNNLSQKHQLDCAVKFYQQFVKEIKNYAQSKGEDKFPITVASHGEWLIPLTINMLPSSDFAFANLNFENHIHQFLYKLHFDATKGPLVISPVDTSFGWWTDPLFSTLR